MVSSSHEAMHRVFQEDPGLFSRACNKLLGIDMPTPAAISIMSPDLTEIRPLERRADTVLRIDMPDGCGYLLVIEAQGKKDVDKPGSWAYYLSYLYTKFRLPPILLVVCQDKATAAWAEEPIRIGYPGQENMTVRAHVLGPHNVPVIRDAQAAAADLPMAVFSAVTHGKSPDAAAILEALFAALDTTEPATAALFAEFTGLGLGSTRAGQIWRNLMSTYTSWFRSPWIETVREEGRIEGRAEARTEDHSDARAEGAAKARSQDVLKVLRKRGISVPSYMAQAIEGCRDLDVLERWFDRSLSITAAGQLFAED